MIYLIIVVVVVNNVKSSILYPCYKYFNRVSITLNQACLMVANLNENQIGPWKLNLGYYLFENYSTIIQSPEHVGQNTTLVLLVEPHSLIFDKS